MCYVDSQILPNRAKTLRYTHIFAFVIKLYILCIKVPYGQRNRAFRTLPEEFTIMKSSIPRAGRGVWTKKDIPECVFIGPFGGEKVYNSDLSTLEYAWRVIKADEVEL